MLQKTKGIVLHTLKYNDTSIIVDIYTELSGRASFLVAVPRSRKAAVKSVLFQPLSFIEFEADYRPNATLYRVKEAKSFYPFSSIPYDPYKSAMALFLSEFLYRAVEAEILKGRYMNRLGFVLEGGSIESDGLGTLLTTSECLLSPNRNGQLNKVEIEEYLRSTFHLERVLWLDYGYLAGDDTDSHIDTLARFCSPDTIAYVQCRDVNDEHYEELHRMEEQLKTFQTLAGEPYKLLALPMADKIEVEGERLPATYANFLIMNNAVLYPTYNQPENDMRAQEVLQKAFPEHEIVGVDCRALIKQHGSLHCVTMQYPMGVIK